MRICDAGSALGKKNWTREAETWFEDIFAYIADRDIRIVLYGHYRIAYLIRSDEDIDIIRRYLL